MEEEKQRILDTYEPILLQDSDSDPEGMQDVPIISYQAALEGLEALYLVRLLNPHVNSQRGERRWRRLLSRAFFGLFWTLPSFYMYLTL